MPKAAPERLAAIAAGESFYFTGKPCSRGHISKRYVSGNRCAKCASEDTMRSMAKKPWHPARLAAKDAGLTHWTTGEPCQNGHNTMRYVSNGVCIECDTEKRRRYHGKRPGVEARWARERRAKDPMGHRAEVERWKAKNPDAVRVIGVRSSSRRRARERGAAGDFTQADIDDIRMLQKGRCAECRHKKRLEIDHIIPLSKGGTNARTNLQLLCRSCNARKNARDPIEWAQISGRLC